jgi:hypothetical protein
MLQLEDEGGLQLPKNRFNRDKTKQSDTTSKGPPSIGTG